MNALLKPSQRFTTAEFHKMARRGAFDDIRVELRRGMMVKRSPKHLPHGMIQGDLVFALKLAVDRAGLNWKVLTETSVSFMDGFDPMPDIVVIDPRLIANPEGTINPEAVKLVVEVADSSLDDDMGEKREDYAASGLAEYWVADVRAKVVHMHARPEGAAFASVRALALSGALELVTQPGIVAKID
jgi:Uma2 family endonuclease